MEKFKALLVVVSTLAFAAGPFLVPGFGGFDPTLYPIPQIDPPVQPAGYAFAIWGVIYVWLVVHAGFGYFKRRHAEDWEPMRWPLIASLAVGAIWLPVAMVSPVWAVILIFFMLVTALMAMNRAPFLDQWFAEEPVALYAGWLTAASFAGLGILGAGYGVVFGQIGWAWIALAGALITAFIGHNLRPEAVAYPLGTAWALIAIMVQNWGSQWLLVFGAFVGAVILLLLAARAFQRQQRLEVR
ncbi:hypothetical protein [Celeribacter arenosi]|uniref:Seryl-tRNA synthetase n=1 Tax=Celeribacter arenosi TaxID=792649 RepID=A0ABP7KBX7_9RHOB